MKGRVASVAAAVTAAVLAATPARADAPSDANVAANATIFDGAGVFIDNVGNFPGRYEPTLPAAMTTFGAAESPWVLPIDFASWRDNGSDLLPQAYSNQFPKVDRPDRTVAHARRAGWPVARVHPVIGVYHHYPAASYVPLLQAAGTTGYSVFIGDQATPADYQALSALNGG